jgi:hypothetical protein
MRIIGIKIRPFAAVLAVIYAVFGVIEFLLFILGNSPYILLPVGIVGLIFHLNFNFPLHRSPDLLYNVFLCFAAIAGYALTGWLTGIAAALCFNVTAKKIGGVDAKYFLLAHGQDAGELAREANPSGRDEMPTQQKLSPKELNANG